MVRKRDTIAPQGLRMKDLTEGSGLPKSTILHYVAEGLLPKPVRTCRNMAYYDPGCIERALYIKTLQARYAFPLAKIKVLLSQRDEGKDVTPLIQLSEAIFGKSGGTVVDEEGFCRATGLTPRELAHLLKARLLIPLEKGRYDQNDIAIGQTCAGALKVGIAIADLAFYPALAREIVDNEMKLRRRLTRHLPDDQDAMMTKELLRGARMLRTYIIERLFQHRVAAAQNLKDETLVQGLGHGARGKGR